MGNGTTTGWVSGTVEITNSNPVIGAAGPFGAALTLPSSRTLRIKDNSQYVQLDAGATLSFTGGKLDLTSKKLIATDGDIGEWNGSNYTGITGQIKTGRNGGAWNGSGIMTSEPLAASQLTTLAVATAAQTGKLSFGGVPVSGNDVLVMYTWTGDANLSGSIDGDDFLQIDAGLFGDLKGYFNGDFDYSGTVDADDYFLIDRAYARQTAPFSSGEIAESSIAAVPEPAGATLIAAAAALLLRRRRAALNQRT